VIKHSLTNHQFITKQLLQTTSFGNRLHSNYVIDQRFPTPVYSHGNI